MPSTLVRQDLKQKYLPILLDTLRIDSVLDFDLYITVEKALVLYRSADLPFTDRTRQSLIENKVERLWIQSSSRDAYQKYIEANLPTILSDPLVQEERKATILYSTSTDLVKDVLANPTYGDNIRRSRELVSSTVGFILQGRDAFLSLMKITSFDYYTYTHSVNVCTFSIALAQQLGYNDEEFLHKLGVGALLHDVGKSKVSDRILHKRSALNQIEFEIMKRHPQWGVDILKETDQLNAESYHPILQHHERGDKRGYPHAVGLDDMHIYSQIVALADSFDAMTTERVYQKAMDTYPALKIMLSLKNAYNTKFLDAFVELMGPAGLTGI